jgi:hypothetical protein
MYVPAVHFTGLAAAHLDVTKRIPWLYILAAPQHKVLYVGETHDPSGLIVRISTHFGPFLQSTFRQACANVAGRKLIKPPFLVVAARLPVEEDGAGWDANSKIMRLRLESHVHELAVRRFVAVNPGWVLVSSARGYGADLPGCADAAGESIWGAFETALKFLSPFSVVSPLHVVLLDFEPPQDEQRKGNLGNALEEIETRLFNWVVQTLNRKFGDRWWNECVPEAIRVECVKRREEERCTDTLPPEAYFSLVDFAQIVKKNWSCCSYVVEAISGEQGKDRATAWISRLNDVRKLWAHPVKRLYRQASAREMTLVWELHRKVDSVLGPLGF